MNRKARALKFCLISVLQWVLRRAFRARGLIPKKPGCRSHAPIAKAARLPSQKKSSYSKTVSARLPDGFTFVQDENHSYDAMEACDGVLTGCSLAIASTGTLALCHQPGQGRRALTLIPDYHLCVVQASSVVETVPEAMQLLEPCKESPITLISGPSATADIEMTRIQGVHGPRILDVLLLR